MKSLKVYTAVRLSPDGRFGAWLFVCAPFVAGLGYAIYLYEVASAAGRYGGGANMNLLFAALLMLAGSIAWLGSIILLLTGRTYVHDVQITDGSTER